jgi:hypothetical protein
LYCRDQETAEHDRRWLDLRVSGSPPIESRPTVTRYSTQGRDSVQHHEELVLPEDIRMSLAADVAGVLAQATPMRTSARGGKAETLLADESGSSLTDRQVLLRAAIADLRVMNVLLHEDRR